MEAASKCNSPVMIQASNGGGQFMAGKTITDKNSCAAGAVALALHVRTMAPYYGIPVIMHSDHCAKKLLPWFDGMLEADEAYFAQYGEPLFSSHMLDLSEEPDDENIAICVQYFKKMGEFFRSGESRVVLPLGCGSTPYLLCVSRLIMYCINIATARYASAPMKIWLEMEIGITGGEEDGVNNEDIDPEKLYTSPEQVFSVYQALAPIGDFFSIAAAFGNVHGVYKPGNVVLSPQKLVGHQAYAKEKLNSEDDKPIYLVMHGGSGSTKEEIETAVSAGVVKMNVDTDTQWAYWDGLRKFSADNFDCLQGQIGNPKGPDAPNKKYYDPRVWIRKAEEAMVARCIESMTLLGCKDTFPIKKPESGSLPVYNFKPLPFDLVKGAKKMMGL
jgi:fructose-bisphosphate aldolase class II